MHTFLLAVLLGALPARCEPSLPDVANARALTVKEIEGAMRTSQSQGYAITETTHGVRFQTETVLNLIAHARKTYREAVPRPLFMGHKEWFEAYLRVTGLTEKQAPVFAYLAYLYKQDLWVDYQYDHVIKKAARDSSPRTAANVLLWWPREKSIPKEFSYIDRRSVPELKVTNRRVIKYRLLDYGDMVVCDDVEGLHGRPNSGILGLMFRVIGEGKVDRCRYAVADDGSQVVQAQCSKGPAWLTTVATVRPDGEAISGVPDDREDLKALEKQLDRKLKTKYQPF